LNQAEIATALREQSEEFRRLEQAHEEFETQLSAINQKKHLSPEEEMERKTIQKKKLKGKDRMAELIREFGKSITNN